MVLFLLFFFFVEDSNLADCITVCGNCKQLGPKWFFTDLPCISGIQHTRVAETVPSTTY